MQYWIDGYNLLFKMPSLEGPLEKRRRVLIAELNRFAKKFSLSFIVVFDADPKTGPFDMRSHYDELEIVYAASKETADEAILEGIECSRSKRTICVVSSDKGLTDKARALGAETLSLSEFVHFLGKKRSKAHLPVECRDSPKEMDRLLKIFESRFKSGGSDSAD